MNRKPIQIGLLALVTVALLLVAYALRPGSPGVWGDGSDFPRDDTLASRSADNDVDDTLRPTVVNIAAADAAARPNADIAQLVDAARDSLRQNNLPAAKLLLDSAQSVHPHDPQVLSLQQDLQAREKLAAAAAAVSAAPTPANRSHAAKRGGGAWHEYAHSGRKGMTERDAAAAATTSSGAPANGQPTPVAPANAAARFDLRSATDATRGATATDVNTMTPGTPSKREAVPVSVSPAGSDAAPTGVPTRVPAGTSGTVTDAAPAATMSIAPVVSAKDTTAAANTAATTPAATTPAAMPTVTAPAAAPVSPATPAAPANVAPSQPQSSAPTPAPPAPQRLTAATSSSADASAANGTSVKAVQGARTRAEIKAELDNARANGSLPKFGNPDPAGPGGALSYGPDQHTE